MTAPRTRNGLTRRTAIAGLGAGGLGVAMAATIRQTAAQEAVNDFSGHPMAGMWLGMVNPALPESPQIPGPAYFGGDGVCLLAFPVADIGQQGLFFQTWYLGAWEPYDDYRAHFTAVQSMSAPDGTFLGTITVDGHPLASNDGMTFSDDGLLVTVTIRDGANGVVLVVPPGTPGRPVTGTRLMVGAPGFPGTPAGATPTP